MGTRGKEVSISGLLWRPIAHRGLHGNGTGIPENSVAAFRRAVAWNYPVEMDVQLLKDGHLAVFHDDTLLRMAGCEERIRNYDAAHVRQLTLAGTKEHVPLLSEVLECIGGKVPVFIELKTVERFGGRLEKGLIQALEGYHGPCAIGAVKTMSL